MSFIGITLLAIGSLLVIAFPFLYKKYMQDWQDEVEQTGEYAPHKEGDKSISEHKEGPEA